MKLYVPNPQKWVNFFSKVSSGRATLNQLGAGRRLSVIPVDESKAADEKPYSIKAVLPAEQTTAQAKSELQRADINPASLLNMPQSLTQQRRRGIKRRRPNKKAHKRAKRQRGSGKKPVHSRKKTLKKGYKKSRVSSKKDIFEIN